VLGREPIPETIILTLGADYTLKINAPDGELIKPGSTVDIKIYPPKQRNTLTALQTWSGTVTPEYVTFRVESEQVDLVPDNAHFRIYIYYSDTPTLGHCWYRGEVARRQ